MLKKMRKKAGALLVMICLGVIILLCWEAGEHLKDKILRSLETAAEARTGKQTVVLDSGHGGSDSGKVGINGAKEKDEYYGAAEPPVRCGESHLSGLTEPPHFIY